jgi:drug/metabolite transporter (DMT)-like permease
LTPSGGASRVKVLGAFGAIYLVWGSTYLAIRIGIESLPPFLMAGLRFFTAGILLYAWAAPRSRGRPTWVHWRETAILGTLMMFGGNGIVTWAEQVVPSGIAAVLITTVPLWMVLLDALLFRAPRPSRLVWLGLLLGFSGVVVLIGPSRGSGGDVHVLGALALVGASFSWALGSLRSRRAQVPSSPFLAAAMEMIGGGLVLVAVGTVSGEWARLDPAAVSLRSMVAFAYLVCFGSILALSAYLWLLRVTTATAVATYAFVNPVIAVLLGWMVLDESLGARSIGAAALIVGAVGLLHVSRMRRTTPAPGVLSGRRLEVKTAAVSGAARSTRP